VRYLFSVPALLCLILLPSKDASRLRGQGGASATFRFITLKDRAQLARVIADPGISVGMKRAAVVRLSELAEELPANKKVKPSELYNPILNAMSSRRPILRETACISLIAFSSLPGSKNLLAPLGGVLGNQKEVSSVRLAAARALGRFSRDADEASDQLISALTKEMKSGPGENIILVAVIINSMGRLRSKKGFVPLMRVINSRFPTSCKRAAQRALENIKWK